MIIKIEDYRGWEISFNTEKETFYTVSDSYDKQQEKRSYASIKKYIDEFIKDNNEFKPFWVEKVDYRGVFKVKVIGIRKDNRFIYEDKKGEKQQLSEYDEKDWYLVNENNVSIYDSIKIVKDKITALDDEKKELEGKVIKVFVRDIKQDFKV
jgi:hypothetical protein